MNAIKVILSITPMSIFISQLLTSIIKSIGSTPISVNSKELISSL